jgi:UDP-3-O-[3-hydroxymyristoyl] glucosamine N-acyltransferase
VTHKHSYTLKEIADFLEVELLGDPQCEIHGLGTLNGAAPGQLSFLSNPFYTDQLSSCKASAIIISEKFAESCPGNKLISPAPYVSFAKATGLFAELASSESQGAIHESAIIHESAQLGENVSVAANVVIEAGVSIGANSVIGVGSYIGESSSIEKNAKLYNGVSIYHKVSIGENVIIHSGAVIGADGFGFAFDGAASVKIHQLGGVVIGDDVEIGANTTIDRGAIEDTVIGNGVKMDNQVQVAHNVKIGDHTMLCGCSGVGGSTTIGKYCIVGGGVGIIGHLKIVDKVHIGALACINQSISEPGVYTSGTPQQKTSDWKRNAIRFQQLDSIAKRLKELEKSTDKP